MLYSYVQFGTSLLHISITSFYVQFGTSLLHVAHANVTGVRCFAARVRAVCP